MALADYNNYGLKKKSRVKALEDKVCQLESENQKLKEEIKRLRKLYLEEDDFSDGQPGY